VETGQFDFFQKFTKQSKCTYGLMLEKITAHNEHNNICTHGSRILPNGAMMMDGSFSNIYSVGGSDSSGHCPILVASLLQV
jgi:hypothetical protein